MGMSHCDSDTYSNSSANGNSQYFSTSSIVGVRYPSSPGRRKWRGIESGVCIARSQGAGHMYDVFGFKTQNPGLKTLEREKIPFSIMAEVLIL